MKRFQIVSVNISNRSSLAVFSDIIVASSHAQENYSLRECSATTQSHPPGKSNFPNLCGSPSFSFS